MMRFPSTDTNGFKLMVADAGKKKISKSWQKLLNFLKTAKVYQGDPRRCRETGPDS